MQRNKYHDHVREALEKDGWTITHDPYFMWIGRRKGYIDLGAERSIIAAERGSEKIAVEIKSFAGSSDLHQFAGALGQFLVYVRVLKEKEPDRELVLAVPFDFYQRFFEDVFFLKITQHYGVKMLIYNIELKEITAWIK